MGKYIQGPNLGKANMLVNKHGAKRICVNEAQTEFDAGQAVICVVDNGMFEAAAYAYSQSELDAFNDPSDYRPKTWLAMDKAVAEELAG